MIKRTLFTTLFILLMNNSVYGSNQVSVLPIKSVTIGSNIIIYRQYQKWYRFNNFNSQGTIESNTNVVDDNLGTVVKTPVGDAQYYLKDGKLVVRTFIDSKNSIIDYDGKRYLIPTSNTIFPEYDMMVSEKKNRTDLLNLWTGVLIQSFSSINSTAKVLPISKDYAYVYKDRKGIIIQLVDGKVINDITDNTFNYFKNDIIFGRDRFLNLNTGQEVGLGSMFSNVYFQSCCIQDSYAVFWGEVKQLSLGSASRQILLVGVNFNGEILWNRNVHVNADGFNVLDATNSHAVVFTVVLKDGSKTTIDTNKSKVVYIDIVAGNTLWERHFENIIYDTNILQSCLSQNSTKFILVTKNGAILLDTITGKVIKELVSTWNIESLDYKITDNIIFTNLQSSVVQNKKNLTSMSSSLKLEPKINYGECDYFTVDNKVVNKFNLELNGSQTIINVDCCDKTTGRLLYSRSQTFNDCIKMNSNNFYKSSAVVIDMGGTIYLWNIISDKFYTIHRSHIDKRYLDVEKSIIKNFGFNAIVYIPTKFEKMKSNLVVIDLQTASIIKEIEQEIYTRSIFYSDCNLLILDDLVFFGNQSFKIAGKPAFIDNCLLYSVSYDNIRIYDMNSLRLLRQFNNKHKIENIFNIKNNHLYTDKGIFDRYLNLVQSNLRITNIADTGEKLGVNCNVITKYANCLTFTMKKEGNLLKLITPQNMKYKVWSCEFTNSKQPDWSPLEEVKGNIFELKLLDNTLVLVIESNGLLDTTNSELSDFDKEGRPLYDGIPISYEEQKSVVVTIWENK